MLARVQADYLGSRSTEAQKRLDVLQSALVEMFAATDTAFQERRFEFQDHIDYMLRTFMLRFDAIFTLNQDSLLERHYLNENVTLGSNGRWTGWQLPGMQPVHEPSRAPLDQGLTEWRARDHGDFAIERHQQPCFKLHGSANWISAEGNRVLILGANKTGMLRGHPVLKWYFDQFREHFLQPVRMMVIGYSFRDLHINEVMIDAAKRGHLELFVIDTMGAGAIGQGNTTRGAAIYARSEAEDILEPALIGASKRSLSEIFGSDRAEHAKVMRFFAN